MELNSPHSQSVIKACHQWTNQLKSKTNRPQLTSFFKKKLKPRYKKGD